MKQPQDISILIAFTAGLLSFVSPCVLPLVPSYITYITGVSFQDLTSEETRKKLKLATLVHSLLFILGFSTIFILMGASASYLGQLLSRYQYWVVKIGGVLIILLGIHFVLQIFPFLQIEKRIHFEKKSLGYLGSFLVGIVFAAGWTPCIGPILSAILIYASTSQNMTTGIALLAAYSLGLGIPFLVASLAFNLFLSAFQKMQRYMRVIIFVSGFFLIAIGILILTDTFRSIGTYLTDIFNPI
ncbi:MAG: cytochrome c biogenesis protein CcdA [Desulfobacterales bacterium]|jgi:cytochrome c-type biogenesis protein|nr:cytochrome c biogenesis protein CcdA [Desulfobacterales bacterium]